MTATFETHPLAEVLRDLLFDQASGVLSVSAPTFRADVMIDRGSIVYCRSDAAAQKLENLLVKWGLITEARVQGLVQRSGGNVRAGLVREGVFPSEAAFDEFMGQILRERVLEIFQQPKSSYQFQARDVSSLKQVAFPSSTPDVILEGCRRLPDAEIALGALAGEDDALQVNERPAVTLESLHMAPAEGYVLSLVTGASDVAEIFRVSPLGRDETIRLLYALLVLDLLRHPKFAGQRFSMSELARRQGIVRAKETAEREAITAEYARLRGLDLFQLVPGAGTMEPAALRQAVKGYQERWRTDRFSPRVARELREQLALIIGRAGELLLATMESERKVRMGEAAESAPPAAGESPDGGADDGSRFRRVELSKSQAQTKAEIDQKEAQAYFTRACDAFRAKDYHSAIQYVRESIRRHETAEYQALLADALSMNPHWGKKAEEAYLRAMQLDHYDARLPLALGRIYARAGLKQRAREQFEKALSLQPESEEIKQALKDVR